MKKFLFQISIISIISFFVACEETENEVLPIEQSKAEQSHAWCQAGSAGASSNGRVANSSHNPNATGDQYVVKIKPWIIKRTNGTGGQSSTDVLAALDILDADFASHGITFDRLPTGEIANDFLYTPERSGQNKYTLRNKIGSLVDQFNPQYQQYHEDGRIDVFLFPMVGSDGEGSGKANGVPGTAIGLGGIREGENVIKTSIISHEMGHALGLYHPGQRPSGCEEYVNEFGSNRQSCGDLVKDTNAMNNVELFDYIDSNCNYTGNFRDGKNRVYTPMLDNAMTLSSVACNLGNFTDGQVIRMKEKMIADPILESIVSTPNSCSYSSWKLSSPITNNSGISNFSTVAFELQEVGTASNISPNLKPIVRISGVGAKFTAIYDGLSFPVESGESVEIEINGTDLCKTNPTILADIQFLKFVGSFGPGGPTSVSVELIDVSANHTISSTSQVNTFSIL